MYRWIAKNTRVHLVTPLFTHILGHFYFSIFDCNRSWLFHEIVMFINLIVNVYEKQGFLILPNSCVYSLDKIESLLSNSDISHTDVSNLIQNSM